MEVVGTHCGTFHITAAAGHAACAPYGPTSGTWGSWLDDVPCCGASCELEGPTHQFPLIISDLNLWMVHCKSMRGRDAHLALPALQRLQVRKLEEGLLEQADGGDDGGGGG